MAVSIQSFKRVVPMIYAYNTPGVTYHEGWTKVGYTEKQTVDRRIHQQTHTADIQWTLAWKDNAMYKDGSGEYFTDHDFHDYLESKGIARQPDTEWFHETGPKLRQYFDDFASRRLDVSEKHCTYTLRREQAAAVAVTMAYFEKGGKEFLWNAKPRFGKTLTAYDLVRQMGFRKVLIVTNRPSIANSWADDFRKFIGWRRELAFVSETEALKGKPGVLSREEYMKAAFAQTDKELGMVAFESLQGLKGSIYFGGSYDKLGWMAKEYKNLAGETVRGMNFDLLIVDESQEGVDTYRTEDAFENISRKHTLYLSGTPFKAIAGERFGKDQIYNWSYVDEQAAKADWDKEEYNPYEQMPEMAMFTYQLSPMIHDKVQKGLDLSGEEGAVDYAFDLNEFFSVNESGRLIHEEEVKKFLHALSTNEKYPYSTPELRQELSHTLWLLNRVASAKALARLLKKDPVFCEYEIVLAAGDGRLGDEKENEAAFDRVKKAIAKNEKTITLSVGQLTVGVTIPEWSGVLMLCNLQSASAYIQAAFRAQNPCILTKNGQRFRKERAYIFDFDPARTLIIFDEYANNLSPETAGGRGTGEDRKGNIRRLLNFFPVLGEDSEGKMVALDAAQVLSIPRRLKSQEVVRRGFMSNFLFQNISNIFGAPSVVKDIVEKLVPPKEEPKRKDGDQLRNITEVPVDENGDTQVPEEIVIGTARDIFGDKKFETAKAEADSQISELAQSEGKDAVQASIERIKDTVKKNIHAAVVAPAAEAYKAKKGMQNQLERQVDHDIDQAFDKPQRDYMTKAAIAKAEHDKRCQIAESEEEIQSADEAYRSSMDTIHQELTDSIEAVVKNTIENKPQEVVRRLEENKAEAEKKSVEDSVREHLRGFSRTIPSFIMAYGDGKLTLQNFDTYTEDDVFKDVTGITEEDFRFLRDGGDRMDPVTGEMVHFAGHLFDETVFNDSVEEFWHKKQTLADYFDESHDEDIFDYIPPQKTNQIFTPRWVVRKMADELEKENPGCFDDPTHTFADLYMKSGLYITEIVKRLFRSEGLKKAFPDEKARIRHILRRQVYGMAPTRIIYLIATNYILGFDPALKEETTHFVEADAAEAAKNGTLEKLVDQYFG